MRWISGLVTLLLLGLALLLGFGCAGDPPADLLARCPTGPVPGAAVTEGLLSAPGDPARGASLFDAECTKCHSPRVLNRSSRLFRGYPRLDCSDYLGAAGDDYLATVIQQGGEAVGLDPAMKPFQEKLGGQDLADLIAFLRKP